MCTCMCLPREGPAPERLHMMTDGGPSATDTDPSADSAAVQLPMELSSVLALSDVCLDDEDNWDLEFVETPVPPLPTQVRVAYMLVW